MYRKSFEDLQVDYIDYYLLHSVGNGGIKTFRARYIDNGMIDFLMEERKAGRIRNLGFSFHGTTDVFDEILAMHDHIHWDFVQIQLNYADWRHASGNNVNAEYLYGELVKRDIPAIIMEPLLGGRLSRLNDHLVARLKQHRPQESVASWAFRFAGSFPKVLTVLSGMTYMEHLQDNLRTYSPLDPCTEEELALLEDTAQVMLTYPIIVQRLQVLHALSLPDWTFPPFCCITTAASTRAIYPKAAGDEHYREARRAFLIGYDRSVPKLRQASHCTGCDQCNPHCPQSIDIPQKLQEIDRFVENLKQERL